MQYLEYLVKIITEKASNRNYAVMLNLLSEINAASTSFLTQSHGQFESKFLVGRKMYTAALQTETLQTTINFIFHDFVLASSMSTSKPSQQNGH